MKWVIRILGWIAIVTSLVAITGISHFYTDASGSVETVKSSVYGRWLAAITAGTSIAAIYGCKRRLKVGWWIVTISSLVLLLSLVVFLGKTLLEWAPNSDVGTGAAIVRSAIEIGLILWFLCSWWIPLRKREFERQAERTNSREL